jgi:cation diffusion facilitator CzcD-associated flavoprotein CzcO
MTKRVCIIGAGPSGLAAAKNCLQAGLSVVVFEKNDRVGGNWVFNAKTGHSSVYENTHMLACAEIVGSYRRPANMVKAIRDEMEHPHYQFEGGARHSTQVDFHMFRAELKRELAKAGIDIGKAPLGEKGKYRPERVSFGVGSTAR